MENTAGNIINDISNTTASAMAGDISAYISLAIYIIIAVFALSGLIFGLTRGFGKTVVRLITIVASIIGAYFIASGISGWIASLFHGHTVEEAVYAFADWVKGFVPSFEITLSEEVSKFLSYFDAQTAQHLISLVVCLVIAPIIFIIVFYILKLITLFISWLVCLMCGITGYDKSVFSIIGGGIVGVAQGLIISLVLLIPISGFTQIAHEVRDEVASSETTPEHTKEQVADFYEQYLNDAVNNPVLSAINNLGGDAIFSGITTATIDDTKINMSDRATTFALMYVDGIPLYDIDAYYPAPWATPLRQMVYDIGEDKYTATTISGIFRGIANALKDGAIVIPTEEPYHSIITDAIAVFETSSYENLEQDLVTLCEIYLILGEYDILSELGEGTSDGLLDKMLYRTASGDLVIDLIIDELEKNTRTHPMISTFAQLSVTALCQSVGLGDNSDELYENVKTGVNQVLATNKQDYETEEEYKTALTENLDATLRENNIELEAEVVDGMADYIAENFSDKEEITDVDISDAILSYYSVYTEYLATNGGELPDELPEGL